MGAQLLQLVGVRIVARARVNLEIGKDVADRRDQLQRRLRAVDRHHDRARALEVERIQDLRAGDVAVEHRQPALARLGDPVRIQVDGDIGNLRRFQARGDRLADPAEAGDHHMAVERLGVLRDILDAHRPGALHAFAQRLSEARQEGRGAHGECDHDQQKLPVLLPEHARRHADAEQQEGELAALRQQDAEIERLRPGHAEQAAQAGEQNRLAEQQGEHQAGDHPALAQQELQVDAHADGDEEQPQQQAAKRLDHRAHLMAVMGLGEQHAGEEGAEGHGQPGQIGEHAGAEHDQQRERGEDLRVADLGHGPEHVAQDDAPDAQDRKHGHRHLERREAERRRDRGLGGAERQHADQQGADRQVLDQEDREGRAPEARGDVAAIGQKPQDDRRRGEREPGADDERGRAAHAGQPGHHRDDRGGHDHLRRAQPEGAAAHHLDAFERQLQADGEEQENDAELAQRPGRLRVADERQPGRPDHRSGDQIAEHRAEPQALKHGDRDDRGQQDNDDLEQVSGLGHGLALSTDSDARFDLG